MVMMLMLDVTEAFSSLSPTSEEEEEEEVEAS